VAVAVVVLVTDHQLAMQQLAALVVVVGLLTALTMV
jgi:hypothetical protein